MILAEAEKGNKPRLPIEIYAHPDRNVIEFFVIARLLVRLLLATLFVFAGVLHLRSPDFFRPIMPPWIPFHTFCILASGIFELLGGVGLLVPESHVQLLTGWGLMLLLLAVFPANIYMAVHHIKIHGFPVHAWMGWARLPLQPLIMLGVAWVTKVWPAQTAL